MNLRRRALTFLMAIFLALYSSSKSLLALGGEGDLGTGYLSCFYGLFSGLLRYFLSLLLDRLYDLECYLCLLSFFYFFFFYLDYFLRLEPERLSLLDYFFFYFLCFLSFLSFLLSGEEMPSKLLGISYKYLSQFIIQYVASNPFNTEPPPTYSFSLSFHVLLWVFAFCFMSLCLLFYGSLRFFYYFFQFILSSQTIESFKFFWSKL